MTGIIDDATYLSDATRLTDVAQISDATRLTGIPQPSSAARLSGLAQCSTPGQPSDTELLSDATQLSDATLLSDATRISSTAQPLDDTEKPESTPYSRLISDDTHISASPTSRSACPAHATADLASFRRIFNALTATIAEAVVDAAMPIRLCVTALMVGGHVLLEDNPGTGKTQLARSLANAVDTTFSRIQFTPDLLPSDVVGVTLYNQRRGEFEFRKGPVFASIVLADEINRACAKTQSALLEVMEENKVTVDGVTHDVPQPFMVIATQNPVEHAGTYALPEAQLDRFLIRTSLGYPSHHASLGMLEQLDIADRAHTVSPVLTGIEIASLRQTVSEVYMDASIREYIMALIEATRQDSATMIGVSMRGALALARCTRVWAAAAGRDYVVPDDVKDLAVAVLAHRLTLTSDAVFTGATTQDVIARILNTIPVPAAGVRKDSP